MLKNIFQLGIMLKALQLKIAVGILLAGKRQFAEVELFPPFVEWGQPIDKKGGKNPDQAVNHGLKRVDNARHFLVGPVGKANDDKGHGRDAGPAGHTDEDQDLHDDDQAQEEEQGVGEGILAEAKALEGQEEEAVAKDTGQDRADHPVDRGLQGALEVVLEAEEGDNGGRTGAVGVAEVFNEDAEGDG